MDIKPVFVIDLSELLSLQKLCYHENALRYNDFTIGPLTQTLPELELEFKEKLILKAVDDTKIVGTIRGFVRQGTCYIGRIAVHPQYQNKGLGTRLIEAIEKSFPQITRYELFTGDRDAKNLSLYQKLG